MDPEKKKQVLEQFKEVFRGDDYTIVYNAIARKVINSLYLEFQCIECGKSLYAIPRPNHTLQYTPEVTCHTMQCLQCGFDTIIVFRGKKEQIRIISGRKLKGIAIKSIGKIIFCPKHRNEIKIASIVQDVEYPYEAIIIHSPCEYDKKLLLGSRKEVHTESQINLLEIEIQLEAQEPSQP